MKKVILIGLLLLSLKSFCQVSPEQTSAKFNSENNNRMGIVVRPYEKLEFIIIINSPRHKVSLVDGNRKILYQQENNTGSFQILNKDTSSEINFYDQVDGTQITSVVENFKGDTSLFSFGKNDVEIKVTSKLLIQNSDVQNQHFIRFLCFSSIPMLNTDVLFSLGKMLPPNSYTEPGSEDLIANEQNIIVEENTYLRLKNYIYNYKPKLKSDIKIRRHNNFTMGIDIDYKYRYYLNHRQTIVFLTNLIIYLKKQNRDNQYYSIFSTIISDAQYALENEGKQPAEPN